MTTVDAFVPSDPTARAAFVDSSALFAYFRHRDDCHGNARAFHDHLDRGELPYRRLYTNDYVLDEVLTGLRTRDSYERALSAFSTVERSELYDVDYVDRSVFDDGYARFVDFHDQSVSFTDCVVAAHAADLGIDHVFTYDDDFAAFDCTVIPHYVS